jgi:hypothetical protein
MSPKRKRKRNAPAKRPRNREPGSAQSAPPPLGLGGPYRPRLQVGSAPNELDQVGVLIIAEQIGLPATNLAGLRTIAARLPFEPTMAFLATLAGRVETAMGDQRRQLDIAEWFFGPGELVDRYRAFMSTEPKALIFGPQSLYILLRLVIEEARESPIDHELTESERDALREALVAANSTTHRGFRTPGGPSRDELLAFELQVGNYHSRPSWMEEIARPRGLVRLATEDPDLLASPDAVPLAEWIGRSGVSADEQVALGFSLGASAHAWDSTRNPYVGPQELDELLDRMSIGGARREDALGVVSAGRNEFRAAFEDLGAGGGRLLWELRPFNTWPFLRLSGGHGLLLLGRPWVLSWLGEGFHYRAMRVAQAEDVARAGGRRDHVQRYTAFAGQVFETYCLGLARGAIPPPAIVLGEERYGKGGGAKTSDIAVLDGSDLILFEVNARRVGAEPLLSGDPLDATAELQKLLVKKVDQLGVAVGALLSGTATLPGVGMDSVERIIPVVLAAGRLWQTKTLWDHLDASRNAAKCTSFEDGRVAPLQALDPGEYEALLAFVAAGASIGDLLGGKAEGAYRHRDFATWLEGESPVADTHVRLPAVEQRFTAMMDELAAMLGFEPDSVG